MAKRIGVYKFVCVETGRFYIGSSSNIDRRRDSHLRSLRRGAHHNIFFQRVFQKYGEDGFSFHVILTDTLEDARRLEQRLLDKNLNKSLCMNIGSKASGGDNLTHNPNRDKIVEKITQASRRRMASMSRAERLAAYSKPGKLNGMYGRTHASDARAIISGSNLGREPANKGVAMSAEQRQLLSDIAQRRVRSPGYVNSFSGKRHSDVTKAILSQKAYARAAAGILPCNTRRVRVGKTTYRSLTQASKALGVVPATVLNRIRSDRFPDYLYLD